MATDYGAPRHNESDAVVEDSLEVLKERHRRGAVASGRCRGDRHRGRLRAARADLSGEELSVRVVPKQTDEFTCSACFLVHHLTTTLEN